MNSKRAASSKNSKHVRSKKKSKKQDDVEPEVFVLPPNLLQKLGINLENIAKPNVPVPENSAVENVPKSTPVQNDVIPTPKGPATATPTKHTSILETAILMKKSVLLSPTFIPSGSHISGELEMSVGTEFGNDGELTLKAAGANSMAAGETHKGGIMDTNTTQSEVRESKVVSNLFTQCQAEQAQANNIAESNYSLSAITIETEQPMNIDNTVNAVGSVKEATVADDHQDEAYLSDCSSSNLSPMQNQGDSVNNVLESNLQEYVTQNIKRRTNDSDRVTIISSETLSPSRMKELKNIHISKISDFIPVTVDSVISTKDTNVKARKNDRLPEKLSQTQITNKPNNHSKESKTTIKSKQYKKHSEEQQAESADATNVSINTEVKQAEFLQVSTPEPNTDTSRQTETSSQTDTKNVTNDMDMTVNNVKGVDFNKSDVDSDMPIDFMVTNLEQHFEENEQILDTFVKHLESSDPGDILETIGKMDDSYTEKTSKDTNKYTETSLTEEIGHDRENDFASGTIDHKNVLKANSDFKNNTHQQHSQVAETKANLPVNKYSLNLSSTRKNSLNSESGSSSRNKHKDGTQPNRRFTTLQKTDVDISNDSTNAEIATEKIAEIAYLLGTLSNKKGKNMKNEKLAVQNTKKRRNSQVKVCTRGVEKPGGLQIKEYKRKARDCKAEEKHSTIVHIKDSPESLTCKAGPKVYSRQAVKKRLSGIQTNVNIDLTNVHPETEKNVLKFCNCGDFGSLAYYDCNNTYEHIHFWDHKTTNCKKEDVLSIHNDYSAVFDNPFINVAEYRASQDSLPQKICWNDIETHCSQTKEVCDVLETLQNNATAQGDNIEKSGENIETATSKQSINKECERGPDSHSQDSSKSHKINSNGKKIEIKLQTPEEIVEAHEVVEESKCKSVKLLHPPNNQDVLTSDELVSVVMVLNDVDDITEQTEQDTHEIIRPLQMQATNNNAHINISSKNVNPHEVTDAAAENKPNIQKRTEKNDVSRKNTPKADAISKKDDLDALPPPEIITKISTRSSRRVSSKDCSPDEEVHLSSAKTRNRKKTPVPEPVVSKQRKKSSISEMVTPERREELHTPGSVASKLRKKLHSPELVTSDRRKNSPSPEMVTSKRSKKAPKEVTEMVTSKRTENLSTPEIVKSKQIEEIPTPEIVTSKGRKKSPKPEIVSTKQREKLPSAVTSKRRNKSPKPEATISKRRKNSPKAEIVAPDQKKDVLTPDMITSKQMETLPSPGIITPKRRNKSPTAEISSSKRRKTSPILEIVTSKKEKKSQIPEIATSKPRTKSPTPETSIPKRSTRRRESILPDKKLVTCGVCHQRVDQTEWIVHIAENHDYLAWKDAETPLDLDDENIVRQHLANVLKQSGTLSCTLCGLKRKTANAYLQHKLKCNASKTSQDTTDTCKDTSKDIGKDSTGIAIETVNTKSIKQSASDSDQDIKPTVKCGKCQETVMMKDWISHIQGAHDYMAWKDGESLDVNNEEEVFNHLYAISKEAGKLVCSKCGLVRIYVKKYLHHVKTCDVVPSRPATYWASSDRDGQEVYTCGVCSEKVDNKHWKDHRMNRHYNLAWIEGDMPIDVKNTYIVEKLLKEYQKENHTFVCKICGLTRASCMGFYAHIIVCGKSEEEVEEFKLLCQVCNKKYLCIYHMQHMAWHRSSEDSRERKFLKEEEKKENARRSLQEDASETPGKRKAAQKAKAVIENYKTENEKCAHICQTCGFATDAKEDFKQHRAKCAKSESNKDGDVDESNIQCSSDDESFSSEVDSDAIEAEIGTTRKRDRKRKPECVQDDTIRFPYVPRDPVKYLLKSGEEFCKFHLSSENLFPEWRTCKYEPISANDTAQYMQPTKQSCKVKFNGDWTTYECHRGHRSSAGYSLFVGSSIQSISWAPSAGDDSANYLAIACHRGMDSPRLLADETYSSPGLIQIWDFGVFNREPEFVFGLAHDFGTVWAIDWCPSGAQDPIPDGVAKPASTLRMGLLAAACSNGSAYIYSVPYPSAVTEKDNLIYKLKPVAELRLSMGSERKVCQATSLRWSPKKGHTLIVVGYGDGTTAYYDLNSESPLLETTENDVKIIYPYHDERFLPSCVLAVDVYPSAGPDDAGAVCAAGATGAAARAAGHSVRVTSRLACCSAAFQPLWPAATLATDNALMKLSVTELEWCGKGRRVGGAGATASCVRCARAALYAPPLLRLLRPHPVAYEQGRKTLGSLQMVHLKKKHKKQTNDGLTTIIEPTSYEEAIQRYGIEFVIDKNLQPKASVRDAWSQRFPLADIVAMAFCPSAAHHRRLAVATQAGLVFVVDAS